MVLFSFEQFIIWFFEKGIKIILILVFAFVLTQVFKILISRFLRHFLKKKDKLEKVKLKLEEERIKTLHNVLYSIAKTIIWIFAVITVLPEVGINITPLLTGLGIGGLALGFGAKNLIQDYISGLFILIED